MNEQLKYAEEPSPFITRDSIMNFEPTGRVIYLDQECEIDMVLGHQIVIKYNGSQVTVHYHNLRVTSLAIREPENTGKRWNDNDKFFLEKNIGLTNERLANLLGRTPQSIANQKFLINQSKHF